jgi:hypothetical protein
MKRTSDGSTYVARLNAIRNEAKQQTIDALVVKFSVLTENLRNVKEAIGTGTLNDAIREAKQLAYSSQTFLTYLEGLK